MTSESDKTESAAIEFSALGLDEAIMRALADVGYETPTPIQAQAIPLALAKKDMIGIAQTGTGKTAAFTIPMIQHLSRGRARARMPRSLILEPTRELAMQVAENFDLYGKHTQLTKALLIGGIAFDTQDRLLDRGVDVLIATPGRLLDHVERGKVLLRGVEILVIDEADRMLDMGFIPDIERIVRFLAGARQTMLFSATMPPEIQALSGQFLSNPERIEVAPPASVVDTVSQYRIDCAPAQKIRALAQLLQNEDITNAIIFCNRKRDIGGVLAGLKREGHAAISLHGDMDQYRRMEMLERFRKQEARYLIASDVAARGLDIPQVSHVFNFDVPTTPEDYVHRIGRTGRAGRSGKAFLLVTSEEQKYREAIEDLTGQVIPMMDGATPHREERSERSERRDDGGQQREDRGGGDRGGGERGGGERRDDGDRGGGERRDDGDRGGGDRGGGGRSNERRARGGRNRRGGRGRSDRGDRDRGGGGGGRGGRGRRDSRESREPQFREGGDFRDPQPRYGRDDRDYRDQQPKSGRRRGWTAPVGGTPTAQPINTTPDIPDDAPSDFGENIPDFLR